MIVVVARGEQLGIAQCTGGTLWCEHFGIAQRTTLRN